MEGKNSGSQEILTQLAADDDASVCRAAIQKLTSVFVVHEMSLNHSNKSVRVDAEKRTNDIIRRIEKD